ncbi:uncharacterized protein EDB93DRAFT_198165 [Suillus bovinus]|uniref:uncharacterized protein n=1 Tax=Suillus bovinus TaxID=48563 RepID=UPI001B866103|nr:uncharacterized protein EDB93DRAFT_198165 [Suillus bovinus]KAG2127726.1 hypothetical protein EDB93DRAFT_198165 [Suillus bovinus]
MHRALLVPDILDHILAFIKADSLQISRRTFAALARTCSALSDASLDALWNELRSLYPLVSCIYDTNMEFVDDGTSKINSDAGPDLSVFHKYAYRVHKVELSGYEGGWRATAVHDDLGVFHVLKIPTPLLPNLTHLAWADELSLALLWPLLNPRLLSLRISSFQWNPKSTPLLLSKIRGLCPELNTLGFLFYLSEGYEAIAESFLSRVICSWKKLEVLDYSPVGCECILSLSALSSLRILRLRVDNTSDLNLPPNSLSFPSLHSLQFQANSLATANSILQAIRTLPKSLDIFLPVYRSGDAGVETVEPILQPISQNASCGNLEEFRMNVPAFLSGGVNGSNVFRPLFLCRNLRVLRIMMTPLFLLVDDDLRAMASAWPLLEELELFDCRNLYPPVPSQPLPIMDLPNDDDDDFPPVPPLPVGLPPVPPLPVGLPPMPPFTITGPMMSLHLDATTPFQDFSMVRGNRNSEITFHGLISLLELCPNLRFFNLAIDATKLDGLRDDKPGGGVCNRLVKHPRLVDSHISDPEAVARILLDILPELETIWGEGSPGPFTNMFSSTLPQGWDQVHRIILDSKAAQRL